MDVQNELDSKTQGIVNLLKQNSASGLKFEDAKQRLLSRGYSEADINLATDVYQYEAAQVSQTSDVPNKVTAYFQEHPDEALSDGANILKAQRKEQLTDERNRAILDAAAAKSAGLFGVMGLPEQIEFNRRFAIDVGVSFWLLIFAGAVVDIGSGVLINWLHISRLSYIINGILSLLLIVFLIKRMK